MANVHPGLLLYSIDTNALFSDALAAALGVPLAPHEHRRFEDGEGKLRPLTDPRGCDAYVVQSLYGDDQNSPHDKLFFLWAFIATLLDHGAARVTAVTPYLAYARKDRQTKPFDPLTLRYVAQLFESVGTSQLMVLEAHNVAAFQSAFRIPALQLPAHSLFDPLVAELLGQDQSVAVAVASPDPGGVKRAQLWRESLEAHLHRPVGFAMVDKRRSAGLVSSENLVAGEVKGAMVLLIDDLIASGDTMRRAATALKQAGAREVRVFAAHGLLTGVAVDALADPVIDQIVVTDSVPTFRLPQGCVTHSKLTVVSAAPLFARAIQACHAAWRL